MKNFPFFFTWSQQKDPELLELQSAQDEFIELKNGHKVIDMTSISFQAILGHSPLALQDALCLQIKKLPMASPKSIFDLKIKTSQKLIDLLKLDHGKIFYTTSGSESIENALKLVRQVTHKKIILAREQSYHGATLGSLSVTGDWRNRAHATIDEWTVRIPEPQDDPDLIQTRNIILKIGAKSIASFCLETITGANGVIIPPKKWWKGIQNLCDEFQIKLILDEVICGFYRTGKNFGFHHYNLRPDIICMAKGMSAGLIPFGACWISSDLSKYYEFRVLSLGLTNYAHPLGLVCLDHVINHINQAQFSKDFKELEQNFIHLLSPLKNHHLVTQVRQIGLLAAIDIKKNRSWSQYIDSGVYLLAKPNMIVLAPPYIIKKESLKMAFEVIKKQLDFHDAP